MSAPSSPVLPPSKDPAYPFQDLKLTQTPSKIDLEAEERRAQITNIALTVLALSIVSTFALIITCCVISVPLTPLLISIGTIFVSTVSSVVLYSNNNVVEVDDSLVAVSGSGDPTSARGPLSFLSKKPTIVGRKATHSQIEAASYKLPNPLNNCFMHATLQLIFQDREVSDYFMQALDAIGKNEALEEKNPALEISDIEIGKQNLYHGIFNGSLEFATLEALETKMAEIVAAKEALEANPNFAKYQEALLAHKQSIIDLKKEKSSFEVQLASPKPKTMSAEDFDTAKAVLQVQLAETKEAIERLEKTKFVLKQELPADAAPGAEALPDIDLAGELTQHSVLEKQLEELQKKHLDWTKFNNLAAAHNAEIEAKFAVYKAINKEALFRKSSLTDKDLADLYYALNLKEAGLKAHELLTKWRAEKELSKNESKLLRVCLVKLIQEKSILHIPQEPTLKKFFSLEELGKQTHSGSEALRYSINRDCPTNIVVIEKDKEGKPIGAFVLFQDKLNPDLFRDNNGIPVFTTKEIADANSAILLASEKSKQPKFKIRNACDAETCIGRKELSSISFSYTSQDESTKLFEELSKSLIALNPGIACPFLPKSYGQTKLSTYDDEPLVEGLAPFDHEECLEELSELVFSSTIRAESRDNTIDLAKEIKANYAKHVSRKPENVYKTSPTNVKAGITEGREYFTEFFKWVDLPKKLIVSPSFASYKESRGEIVNTLTPKSLNFSDNKNLIIDLSSIGEKPSGEKSKGGKYILNGFTLKSGSESGGHYVYYSRRYAVEGDISSSYWIINNDGRTYSASCEQVAEILLTRDEVSFPNTLFFDQLQEPPVLEDEA
jgi:hypothetical protein